MGENEPSPLGMFSPLYDDPVWRAWYMLEGTADRRDDYWVQVGGNIELIISYRPPTLNFFLNFHSVDL